MFRLASMTKPIIAVAILQLVEDGQIDLDEPVARFIPAYARTLVMDLPHPEAARAADPASPGPQRAVADTRALLGPVPARRQITVRDLLTHSSGLGHGPGSAAAVDKACLSTSSLEERIEEFAKIPGDFHPGEATGYSPIVGFDILGRVIELLSGEDLETHLHHSIFGPLGMVDTTFTPTPEQRCRSAKLYELREGKLSELLSPDPLVLKVERPKGCCCGSAGLHGTLADYDRFARMLLRGGELDGNRILAPQTVTRLFSERGSKDHVLEPGARWGLGVAVIEEGNERRSAGSWGWSGAFGTHFYVDPANRQTVVLMLNRAGDGGAAYPISSALEEAVLRSSTLPGGHRPMR